jgi:hypothetical protein
MWETCKVEPLTESTLQWSIVWTPSLRSRQVSGRDRDHGYWGESQRSVALDCHKATDDVGDIYRPACTPKDETSPLEVSSTQVS